MYLFRKLLGISFLSIVVFHCHIIKNFSNDRTHSCPIPNSDKQGIYAGMVWIPSGNLENKSPLYPEEISEYKKTVSGFWMDRTETTNDAFAEFVRETGYITEAEITYVSSNDSKLVKNINTSGSVVFLPPNREKSYGHPLEWWQLLPGANWRHPQGSNSSIEGKGSYPVVAVTYQDALAYALWKGRHLPSESEWEWASTGGTNATDSNSQPEEANTWQGDFPLEDEGKDGFKGISPVGCYMKNGFGLYDMIGNVWEHTSDTWESSEKNTTKARVIKGGSYLCSPNYCKRYRSRARQPQEEHLAASHIGFRTILRENKEIIKN